MPVEAWLPVAVQPNPLESVSALVVTNMTGSSVTVNTGISAPSGGGFEVRSRDNAFVPGSDSGLVMRSSVESLSFARSSASDRFFIRMYDASTPPNYSEFSAELAINLPVGA